MNILVAGSRNFKDKDLVIRWLSQNLLRGEDVLINGNCKTGVDAWALTFAKNLNYEVRIFDPDWEKFGRAAGPIRNEEMVKVSDKVVCFWDGSSNGTKSTIDYTLKYKKDLEVIF